MKKLKTAKKNKTDNPNPFKATAFKYDKIILKISGEILGKGKDLFNLKALEYITSQIVDARATNAKIGVVLGGGNIMRGREISWLKKVDADVCGMLATIINGVILYSQLCAENIPVRLCSGLEVNGIVKRSNKFEDKQFYESGGVLLFVAGTGNPLFTTDTAAALRAVEFEADILIKATKVEGVYSADPKKYPTAKFYKKLTFQKAIEKRLEIMDLTAFNICRETNTPICVYDCMKYPLRRVILDKNIGTLVTNGV